MEHTKIVSPMELENYADRRGSEQVLPELISLLIKLSCPDLTLCRIPYEDVTLPGLDGLVQTEGGFKQFVPKQISYWEMGRSEGAQAKATEDFRKRSDETNAEERAEVTFVFVTPRSRDWDQASQNKWLGRRKNKGWKAIKILDGIQLCEWLREFPAVGKWLLQQIGQIRNLTGFRTAAEHWINLEQLTGKEDPPLPAEIFLAGRDVAAQQLDALFLQKSAQLILAIESENDAEDFVAAFIQSQDESRRREYSGRCLFISEPDAWHSFSALKVPHVLIASPRLLTETFEQLHIAARVNGHAIVFPVLGARSYGGEDIFSIQSPSQNALERALVEAKFSLERARQLASAGANSLVALKRFLRGLGELPPYVHWESARTLAQASLIGGWKGTNQADREAIELLLGKSYGEWIETVRADALRPDTPLIQRNETWRVISRSETWKALAPRVADDDLDRLRQIIVKVLSDRDASLGIQKDERQSFLLRSSARSYSSTMRSALAESLALLGAFPSALSSVSHGKAETTVRLTVRSLLKDSDWISWANLNDEMPLIAEGSPEEFLGSVAANLLDASTSIFAEVFKQEGSGFGGRNYLTGILWALETLAWSPDYLGQVTLILGDLASLDPGGNWGNRPASSLRDIYLPWHVQTLATLPERQAALSALLREQPNIGWKLLLNLLPSAHSTTSGTRKPAWRSFVPRDWRAGVTGQEYWDQIRAYADMCITVVKSDQSKLAELVDQIPSLPEPAYSQVLDYLASASVTSLSDEDRRPIWEALSDLALKHRRFADAQWALPADRVEKIESVAALLTPASFELSQLRFFSERDWDLYSRDADFKSEAQKLADKRSEIIRTLLDVSGIEGVLRFASRSEAPQKVGDALGAVADATIDSYLLPSFLRSSDKAIVRLISAFLWRSFWQRKSAWLDEQLCKGWPVAERLALLLKLPATREVWQRAKLHLGEQEDSYWQEVQLNAWGLDSESDLFEAAEKLVDHGQASSAIDCLYILVEKKASIPLQLATRALLGALAADTRHRRIEHHQIGEVIKWLQRNAPPDSDDLFKIEWNYLPLLDRMHGLEPTMLERKLSLDPAFYGQVIAAVFRSSKSTEKEKDDPSEQEQRVAHNAYTLLHGWRLLPGHTADGSFDGRAFTAWLNGMKTITTESGHLRIAMDQLGQALTFAPPDPDGLWIHRSVAGALDAKDALEMRKAFAVGLFNSRGVHGFSKGAAEKNLAVAFEAKARALRDAGFHRFAEVVKSVAQDYRIDAAAEATRDIFERD